MGEIPHEKALVQRFPTSKFALLGINTDDNPKDFREKCQEHGVTWDNIYCGSPKKGVVAEWGVRGFPTTYLLDSQGIIRYKNLRGEDLDQKIEELLAEMSE